MLILMVHFHFLAARFLFFPNGIQFLLHGFNLLKQFIFKYLNISVVGIFFLCLYFFLVAFLNLFALLSISLVRIVYYLVTLGCLPTQEKGIKKFWVNLNYVSRPFKLGFHCWSLCQQEPREGRQERRPRLQALSHNLLVSCL